MIKYSIENFDSLSVSGWAHDDEPGSGTVKITIAIEGGQKTTEATIFREHLKQAGVGTGAAGFEVVLGRGEHFDPNGDISLESKSSTLVHRLSHSLRFFLSRENSGYLFLNSTTRFIRCAVALIIKNEATYLTEWLEYHRILGVDHFLIFDNESTDDLCEVLRPYLRTGLVTLVSWPNLSGASEDARRRGWLEQDTAYACAVKLLAGKAFWLGFLDVDEFVVFEGGKKLDLKEFLDGIGSPTVSLFWRLFGSSGIEERPPGLVIENFVKRGPDSDGALMKVFVRPEHVHSIANAHRIVVGPERTTGFTTEGSEALGKGKLKASYRGAFIHHYHTRSRSEYKRKVQRGWPKNTDQKNFDWEGHFRMHDRNDLLDNSIVHFSADVRERVNAMSGLIKFTNMQPLVEQWIVNYPPTMLFHVEVIEVNQLFLIEGFLVDVALPSERYALVFHDGYGSVLGNASADAPCEALRVNRIGDACYGFKVSLPLEHRVVHFQSKRLAGTLCLHRTSRA